MGNGRAGIRVKQPNAGIADSSPTSYATVQVPTVLNQQLLTELLLCAGPCSRGWGPISE